MAKEAIREKSFLDGKKTGEFIGRRTVYRNKDGKPFIRDRRGKQLLYTDPDGMLVLDHIASTIKAISPAEFKANLLSKLRP